jgi:hypothetical protein
MKAEPASKSSLPQIAITFFYFAAAKRRKNDGGSKEAKS